MTLTNLVGRKIVDDLGHNLALLDVNKYAIEGLGQKIEI